MADREPIDWEAIERKYRAGVLSVREIAREHNISHTLIQKKAKAEGWERDLSKKVRQKAAAEVAKDAVANEVASGNTKAAEREIIEANAAIQVNIVRQHRAALHRQNEHLIILQEKLEALLPAVDSMKGIAEAQDIVESMARMRAKLIPLERQAFGMLNKDGDDDAGGGLAERLAAARKRLADADAS